MLKDFSIQATIMGTLVAFVGFISSFAVIMQGLTAMGAAPIRWRLRFSCWPL